MINTLYLPELREMLATHDAEGLRVLHPTRHDRRIHGGLTAARPAVLQHADAAGGNLRVSDQAKQIEIARRGPRRIAAPIGDRPDDRVDLLTEVAPSTVGNRCRWSPSRTADIRRLAHTRKARRSGDTTAFARVREDFTARQALDEVIRQAAELETIYYVYVVDEASHQGVVSSASCSPRCAA